MPLQFKEMLLALVYALISVTVCYQLRKTVRKFTPVLAHCLIRPILAAYYRHKLTKQIQVE